MVNSMTEILLLAIVVIYISIHSSINMLALLKIREITDVSRNN